MKILDLLHPVSNTLGSIEALDYESDSDLSIAPPSNIPDSGSTKGHEEDDPSEYKVSKKFKVIPTFCV
jgi:hypothetical protein